MQEYKTDERAQALQNWVSGVLPDVHFQITPLAGDASFRRYFRVLTDKESFVAMDAPPSHEDCKPFVAIDQALLKTDVRAPMIFAKNLTLGFLLLSDFGDTQLQSVLDDQNAEHSYHLAMQDLLSIQTCSHVENYSLPNFDENLYWKEFEIFSTWYVQKNLNLAISAQTELMLKNTYRLLINSANSQPQVFVHRDYHSRNLMCCADGRLGILDFQDAVMGPITYDLVSLLKDCYVAWPKKLVESCVALFYEALLKRNKINFIAFNDFLKYFDLMGLQRHIKCLGIFSRLAYRDNKQNYLKEIPRVLNYVLETCEQYPEYSDLKNFLLLTEKNK